jgi:RimJ/RimL family protein N-acetyltransferase
MIMDTDRLTLRLWQPEDFEDFAAMSAEPEVMKFIALDGKPAPRFLAWQGFCALVGHWELRGFGMFVVIERATGEFVGRVGPWDPEGWPGFEVGWTIRKKFWGRGYATEAAHRCIEYVFTDLDRPHLISLIDAANIASIRVAERVGEHLEGKAILPHSQKEVLQYGLSREEWRRNRAIVSPRNP